MDKYNLITFSYRKQMFLPPNQAASSFILESKQIKIVNVMVENHLTFRPRICAISCKISNLCDCFIVSKFIYLLKSCTRFTTTLCVLKSITVFNIGVGPRRPCWAVFRCYKKRTFRVNFNAPLNSHTNIIFKGKYILKMSDIYQLKLKFFFSFYFILFGFLYFFLLLF